MEDRKALKIIGEKLAAADNLLLFPHINPDGDAIGSCAALCHSLRNMGKKCYVVTETVPENLMFMDHGYFVRYKDNSLFDMQGNFVCELTDGDGNQEKKQEGQKTADGNIFVPDICVCVDLADFDRLKHRQEVLKKGKATAVLDHHDTGKPVADYNYIDPEAAAAGEIIFALLEEMEIEIDKETGEALFAAITTDTGDFQYSNTTKKTHEITAKLYDSGIDANKVSVEIYENVTLNKLMVTNRAIDQMEIFAEGKAAISYVTQKMLKECGAAAGDTEGIVQVLRSIAGVEIAAFLKENEEGDIRVSLRAKRERNVAKIAMLHNGGGHIKAAGCTLKPGMSEGVETIKKEIEEALRQNEQGIAD